MNNPAKSEPLPELKFDKQRFRVENCPCGKSNKDGKFVPFVGYANNGYCHSCGETFLPELPQDENWNLGQPTRYSKPKVQKQRKIDVISGTLFRKQLSNGIHLNRQNHFIQWLGNSQRGEFAFDPKTINQIIGIYFLGNSTKDKYKGWVLFPYIDINGKIRDIKAMDYNPNTGKRIKEPFVKCCFLGKEILNNTEANTVRCYYGEHLLRGNKKIVRIFESEASATYAAPFYNDSVCIATGGNHGCKWTDRDNCNVLQGRIVILYPDIDAHYNWEQKAEILRGYGITVEVSQLIKNSALKYAEQNGIDYSELVKCKFDLRDILQHKKLSNFLKTTSNESPTVDRTSFDIEILPALQPNEDNKNLQIRSIPAYVSETGELYIETPIGTTYTIYPSINHYNNRLCLPEFIDKNKISIDGYKVVQINLDLLKIILKEG